MEREPKRGPVAAPFEAERKPLVVPALRARPAPAAAEADPWVAENNRAARLLGEGELESAIEVLERCHAAQPENDVFRRNLAEALVRSAYAHYADHRIQEALAALSRALDLEPEREDAARLESIRAGWLDESRIEERQWTESSDLFELAYDGERVDILEHSQAVLDHLERSYDRFREWFGRDPVREGVSRRIRVVLYRPEEFDRITGIGDWAGGAFDGVVRVSLASFDPTGTRWKAVLDHELVHAFVRALGGIEVPGWLNEGLAQILEPGTPDLGGARERLAGGPLIALERLEGSLAGWEDPAEILRAYAQSLLLVERIHREWGEEALRRMILSCGRGVSPDRSFQSWTGVPLSAVVEDLLR